MIGLKQHTIELVHHHPDMDDFAKKLIESIKTIFNGDILHIDHIGSTSIPTIKAKPIIDLALHVRDFDQVTSKLEAFRKLGFTYKGKAVLPNALYFNLTIDSISYCHLHVFENYAQEWKNHLYFRDYLRKYPEVAKEYEALKEALMHTHRNDRVKYTNEKASFILNTVKDAQCDAFLGKTVTITIDRPIGTIHPKHSDIIYPINYGYIENELALDNEELDVYLIGVSKKVETFTGKIIGYIKRHNDVENKLIMAPDNNAYDTNTIKAITNFQEQFYESDIVLI
jgi:GrpB-like predicted nucleotidyltransferase (UPF0157 family)